MELAAGGHVMDSNSQEQEGKSSKITIRIRRKINNNGKDDNTKFNTIGSTGKTSFNLHKQISLDPNNRHSIIDARSNSPLGHFNKRWMSMSQGHPSSQSVPTSPSYTASLRISPMGFTNWKNSDRSQSTTQSPVWNKKSSESDTSSIASNDSAFEDGGSGISSKSWHPGINYKPTHPLYLPQPDIHRRSSEDSLGSGGSTTPTPGTPEMNRTLSSSEGVHNTSHSKSRHKRRGTESASQVELNIEQKTFSEQDKQILEGYFQTSSRKSGQKNFINSAVYKEKSSELDTPALEPLKVKPLTPNLERARLGDRVIDKKKVRVFPESSPLNVVTDSQSPRVSSLVNHFNNPTSPQLSPRSPSYNSFEQDKTSLRIPIRPSSAGKTHVYQTQPIPNKFEKSFPQESNSTTSHDFTLSAEVVKSKPYETNLFQSPANRQTFLNSYLERLHNENKSSSSIMGRNLRSDITTPDMKRAAFSKRISENNALTQMRPLSTSMLLTKQDTFTNDPYKRKSFLDKYLDRQGKTCLISKKATT
ncbi:hypothetical protein LOD99_4919 [Oopsacas minuta]|uniref:Uncharacterized protein n=1 Tax=Oopsacas minuta TaxID=111878 RepID=A0AAV7JTD8_9METZ|nr:hypothetical protein LOD99_4919 [Oopsacas minuta]